jgi:hypothetical protein
MTTPMTTIALILCSAITLVGCGEIPEDSTEGAPTAQASPEKHETSAPGSGDTELVETALSTSVPYVGVIPTADPDTANCPTGPSGKLVAIRMDDEDSSNNDQLTLGTQNYSHHNAAAGGLIHSSSPRVAGGNTWIKYCPTQISSLPVLSHDYAVISASNVCPANSYRFGRRFDNEDGSNHNAAVGDISPNSTSTAGGSTWIYFCFVPGVAGRPVWDAVLSNQIVFTVGPVSNKGTFYTDDEDDASGFSGKNGNGYSVATNATAYTARMKILVSDGQNTRFSFGTNDAIDVIDLGTTASCADSNYKVGFKCSYTTSGTFKGCQPVGGLSDWWAFAKDMFCRW